jgi:hypothetical protein
MLEETQALIRSRALAFLEKHSVEVATLDELREAFPATPPYVFANAPFCSAPDCEKQITDAVHAVSVRCLRDDRCAGGAPCIVCGTASDDVAVIARAY